MPETTKKTLSLRWLLFIIMLIVVALSAVGRFGYLWHLKSLQAENAQLYIVPQTMEIAGETTVVAASSTQITNDRLLVTVPFSQPLRNESETGFFMSDEGRSLSIVGGATPKERKWALLENDRMLRGSSSKPVGVLSMQELLEDLELLYGVDLLEDSYEFQSLMLSTTPDDINIFSSVTEQKQHHTLLNIKRFAVPEQITAIEQYNQNDFHVFRYYWIDGVQSHLEVFTPDDSVYLFLMEGLTSKEIEMMIASLALPASVGESAATTSAVADSM